MKFAYALLVTLLLVTATAIQADNLASPIPASIATSVIDGQTLSGARGRNAVNMAAGDANTQMNAAAIALTPNGIATGSVLTQQQNHLSHGTAPNIAIANIGGHAFTHTAGALSINQTSGAGNAQTNGLLIGIGLEVDVMSESMLSNMTTGAGLAAPETHTGVQKATIADTAFSGSRGLLQINQSAGSRNTTANRFVLQVEPGTK